MLFELTAGTQTQMGQKHNKMRSSKPAKGKGDDRNFVQRSRSLSIKSDESVVGKLPKEFLEMYEVHEWKHALAILMTDFPSEFNDIIDVLSATTLKRSDVVVGGGGKTKIAQGIDKAFKSRGWVEKSWDTEIVVDGKPSRSPTHSVDCYKNKVALELEWSNKDPFYDRDLNNFRLLFDLRVISVGVIVTKSDELAAVFHDLGIWSKYGTSTTWMSKLTPRLEGGGGGGCPVLVFGFRKSLFAGEE